MHQPTTWIGKLLAWRIRHLHDAQFVLLLSVLLGIMGGLVSALFKFILEHTHQWLTQSMNPAREQWLYLVLPVVGILLTVALIRFLYRGQFAHGITNVLYSISRQSSIVKAKNVLYFAVGSLFTVGMGGSVGMEATMVMTGSGMGSNVARVFRLPYQKRVLLLGCGASGALAAFFHAPIAGVIFALEVLMLDLTMASLIPLLAASISGTITARILLPEDTLFLFKEIADYQNSELIFYAGLAVVSALTALYLVKVDQWVERMGQFFTHWWVKSGLGALLVGILIFLFPPLFGEGFDAINVLVYSDAMELVHNTLFFPLVTTDYQLLLFLVLIILAKAFAVALTLGSGGIGGYFAPSLFMGGLIGFVFAHGINLIYPEAHLSEASFTLVGMAGAMSSVFYAPLTAIFLIAEITNGYNLIVPLMVVALLSYTLVRLVAPHSMFTRRLAARGDLITHHKDRAVITMLNLMRLLETNFVPITSGQSLGTFLKEAVARSSRNLFPVVEDGKLVAIVLFDDVRPMIFKHDMYDKVKMSELMRKPPAIIHTTDTMSEVIRKFDETEAWNLPVTTPQGDYKGFISRSKLLSAYRDTLRKMSNE